MVMYIPGPEAILAPAAREISEGVMKYLQPNKEFQQGMQRALATNPQLLGQLADVEHSAPGTLERLGFGPLAGVVQQLPESPEAEAKRTERPSAVAAERSSIRNAAAQNEMLEKTLRRAAELMAGDSELTTDAAYKLLTGQNEAQHRAGRAAADVAEAEAPAKVQAAKLEGELIGQTIADLPEIGEIDLYQLAQDFRRGRLDDYSVVASIYRAPGVSNAFEEILNKLDRDDAAQAQREMWNLRDTASDTDQEDHFYRQRAALHYGETDAGSIGAWKRFLEMPATERAAIADLAKKPVAELTVDERELVEVFNANRELTQQRAVAASRVFTRDLLLSFNRANQIIQGTTDKRPENPVISGVLSEMNQMLADRAAITGQNFRVNFGKIPGSDAGLFKFRQDTGIYFTNEDGDVVDVSDVTAPVTSRNSETELKFQRTISTIGDLPADQRDAQIARLKTLAPDIYQDVVNYFANQPADSTAGRGAGRTF